MAAASRATPNILAVLTSPGRILYIQRPIKMAMGMVAPTTKTPQKLSKRAFRTAIDRPASVRMRIKRKANDATIPTALLTSLSAILARLCPLWRMEAKRTTISWTPPPRTQPIMIQRAPGRKPNCAANTGPRRGPAAAMAAKWCPNRTNLFVFT